MGPSNHTQQQLWNQWQSLLHACHQSRLAISTRLLATMQSSPSQPPGHPSRGSHPCTTSTRNSRDSQEQSRPCKHHTCPTHQNHPATSNMQTPQMGLQREITTEQLPHSSTQTSNTSHPQYQNLLPSQASQWLVTSITGPNYTNMWVFWITMVDISDKTISWGYFLISTVPDNVLQYLSTYQCTCMMHNTQFLHHACTHCSVNH